MDLDALARIGLEDVEVEMEGKKEKKRRGTAGSQRSFDDLVGRDGKLKGEEAGVEKATGAENRKDTVRKRGVAGLAAGSAAAAAVSNPFSDDQVLFDNEDEEAKSPEPFPLIETRESSATIGNNEASPKPSASGTLIDLTPASNPTDPENPQTASTPPSEASVSEHETDPNANSFYSFASTSSPSSPELEPITHPTDLPVHDIDSDAENLSTGTLTPRSERSAFTSASVVGSQADDIAVLSMQNDTDHDDRSEVFTEGGFSDVGSLAGGRGAMTPSSWTDVGSDDGSEWGGVGSGGNVHQ